MPMTNEEYIKGDPQCPYCASEELEWGDVFIDCEYAKQEVKCCECGKEWHDVYELKGWEKK